VTRGLAGRLRPDFSCRPAYHHFPHQTIGKTPQPNQAAQPGQPTWEATVLVWPYIGPGLSGSGKFTPFPDLKPEARRPSMSIVKVIEVIASSSQGWEKAAQIAVKDAGKSVKNIKHFYVENMTALVEDGKISEYRINGKISFVVKD
jgi:flavin-binding protein dodecin